MLSFVKVLPSVVSVSGVAGIVLCLLLGFQPPLYCIPASLGNACAHYAEVPCGKDAVKRSGCVNSAGQSEDSKGKALSGADFVCAVANPAGIT